MTRFTAEVRVSETMLIKRENRLLWVMVIGLALSLFYKEWQTEQTLARITPQSVMDACNHAKEAK